MDKYWIILLGVALVGKSLIIRPDWEDAVFFVSIASLYGFALWHRGREELLKNTHIREIEELKSEVKSVKSSMDAVKTAKAVNYKF